MAEDIVLSGHLSFPEERIYYDTQNLLTPVFNILLAFSSSSLDIDTSVAAHIVVAMSSAIIVLVSYLICYAVTRSTSGSIAGALFLTYLGTFVYLSGSAWKASFGIALLMIFIYSYMMRNENRMLVLGIAALVLIPLVHHLVALVAFTSFAFLTLWSFVHAYRHGGFRKRHAVDFIILAIVPSISLCYYSFGSVEKLSYIASSAGLFTAGVIFSIVSISAIHVLSMKRHSRFSYAPLLSVGLLFVFTLDYVNPLFPYAPGVSNNVLILGIVTVMLVGISWFGLEHVIESDSRFRAISLCTLLPVVMAMVFAITIGQGLAGHQLIYRTFDFADISLSMGIASAVAVSLRIGRRRMLVGIVILLLLVSYPFGYFSGPLLGIRHDTQAYEIDALSFAKESSSESMTFQSDERLSYIAMAMFDYQKLPTLPSKLMNNISLNPGVFYAFEDEWAVIGVNDYPRGHPIIADSHLRYVLDSTDVVYVGGPVDNRITLFLYSYWGLEVLDST